MVKTASDYFDKSVIEMLIDLNTRVAPGAESRI